MQDLFIQYANTDFEKPQNFYIELLQQASNYKPDVFSTLPDFDREKTNYQVEYAKKKKYTPYQCSTLQSISLCMKEKYKDELCQEGYGSTEPSERKKLKHPLAYVRIKQYRNEKQEKFLKNKVKREQEESQKKDE